jgi:hypothetical protein
MCLRFADQPGNASSQKKILMLLSLYLRVNVLLYFRLFFMGKQSTAGVMNLASKTSESSWEYTMQLEKCIHSE